jgi:DNA-binding beta-propeller fold protein YncE
MILEAFNANPVSADPKVKKGTHAGRTILAGLGAALLLLCVSRAALADPSPKPPFLPAQGSTSPSNGDLVPYGLAVVPDFFPGHTLKPGQLLVSNFNNSAANGNLAGQGSTIVIIDPNTAQQLGVFFQGTSPIGFTNALAIVKAGFVFAGSVFTTLPDASDPTPGPLLVLDKNGNQVDAITTGTNGPWGLAVNDQGNSAQLFVSNVFDGTVTRLKVSFKKGVFSVVGAPTTIASGYAFNLDASALVVGPAGLAYDCASDRLYVASEDDNEIFVIKNASTTTGGGKGTLVFSDSHLEGPLGLIIAPNGHLITANADPTAFQDPAHPSELVEFTKKGTFVREFSIDSQLGGAFAILNVSHDNVNQFAWVDDVPSTISILRLSSQ